MIASDQQDSTGIIHWIFIVAAQYFEERSTLLLCILSYNKGALARFLVGLELIRQKVLILPIQLVYAISSRRKKDPFNSILTVLKRRA